MPDKPPIGVKGIGRTSDDPGLFAWLIRWLRGQQCPRA